MTLIENTFGEESDLFNANSEYDIIEKSMKERIFKDLMNTDIDIISKNLKEYNKFLYYQLELDIDEIEKRIGEYKERIDKIEKDGYEAQTKGYVKDLIQGELQNIKSIKYKRKRMKADIIKRLELIKDLMETYDMSNADLYQILLNLRLRESIDNDKYDEILILHKPEIQQLRYRIIHSNNDEITSSEKLTITKDTIKTHFSNLQNSIPTHCSLVQNSLQPGILGKLTGWVSEKTFNFKNSWWNKVDKEQYVKKLVEENDELKLEIQKLRKGFEEEEDKVERGSELSGGFEVLLREENEGERSLHSEEEVLDCSVDKKFGRSWCMFKREILDIYTEIKKQIDGVNKKNQKKLADYHEYLNKTIEEHNEKLEDQSKKREELLNSFKQTILNSKKQDIVKIKHGLKKSLKKEIKSLQKELNEDLNKLNEFSLENLKNQKEIFENYRKEELLQKQKQKENRNRINFGDQNQLISYLKYGLLNITDTKIKEKLQSLQELEEGQILRDQKLEENIQKKISYKN